MFVSDPCQFTVDRGDSGWFVTPARQTVNPTLLNGRLVAGPVRLNAGDVLGVGDAAGRVIKLPLTVEFKDQ